MCATTDAEAELCDYEFTDFEDYLIHNYYHAHITRITAISEKYTSRKANIGQVQSLVCFYVVDSTHC